MRVNRIAYWGNTRCRLWLYPSPRGKTTVTIRRYYLQRGLNHLELPGAYMGSRL